MAAVASPYLIRPMTVADIPHVTDIERESFPTMWPQTAYKRELQQNSMARYLVVGDESAAPDGGPLPVPDRSSRRGLLQKLTHPFSREEPPPPGPQYLAGFVGLWFMLEECHIVTVAVRAAHRRRGIGELLVITAVEMALKREQNVLTLECRVSNVGAQALYDKYGFARVGLRRRYYTDNNEDALIMTTPPIHTAEFRGTFARLRTVHQERWGAARIDHPEL